MDIQIANEKAIFEDEATDHDLSNPACRRIDLGVVGHKSSAFNKELKNSFSNYMYKEIFASLRNEELRYISMGWTRIRPFYNDYSTHSKISNAYNESTAEICLEFGSQMDKLLLLSCHCLDNEKGDYYKLKITEIEKRDNLTNINVSVELDSLYIESIQLYETNRLFSEQETYVRLNYLSDALLIKFNKHQYVKLIGTIGDDEHEPCIFIEFFTADDYHRIEDKYLTKWKLRDSIIITPESRPITSAQDNGG